MVKYRVFQNGSLIATVDAPTTEYNVTGLTAETEYTFKVEAGDAADNWSTDGPSVTLTTAPPPETEPPTWPEGSSLETLFIDETDLTLEWDPAEDNVGVVQYRAYRDGTLIATVDAPTTLHFVTGLEAGTEYTFEVEAGDAAGNFSPQRLSLTVTTADFTEPTWPEDSALTADVRSTGSPESPAASTMQRVAIAWL